MIRIGPRTGLLVLAPVVGCAGAERAPFDGMVSAGGQALHVRIRGSGGPTHALHMDADLVRTTILAVVSEARR